MCIGMNGHAVPLHCTQNATRGEEWRRGWHPEKFEGRHAGESVLVVGAGPAGLEATRVLGMRGYTVTLAEATTVLGGRVTKEAGLPGLGEWLRVRDYRVSQIGKMTNVDVYRDSRLSKQQILDFGFDHVAVATGSSWRRDGRGRSRAVAFDGSNNDNVITPDEIMLGATVNGPIVVYDDDNFYLGGLIAQRVREQGHEVILVTSASVVSPETSVTLEQHRIHALILEKGIRVVVSHVVERYDGANVTLTCVFGGTEQRLPANTLIPVTSREPDEGLYLELVGDETALRNAGIKSVQRIGDCAAPGPIAAAMFSGHKYGRGLGSNQPEVLRDGVHAFA
jgi:dimethylamine/trimethylamine dehydrogenase